MSTKISGATAQFNMAIDRALGWARKSCDHLAGSDHLLIGLLEMLRLHPGETVAERVLARFGVDHQELENDVDRRLLTSPAHHKDFTALGKEAEAVLEKARESSDYVGDGPMHTGHLLVGLIRQFEGSGHTRGIGGFLLFRACLDATDIQQYLLKNSDTDGSKPDPKPVLDG